MSSPNRDALVRVAGLLGPIAAELVFVGGRVAELLVSEPGSTRARPTDDSDAVAEVATRTEYYRLGERLRAAGFTEDATPGAPICRWRQGDELLDVLPVEGGVLGFRNAWYHHAVRRASSVELAPGVVVRICPAPVFLATKWDASMTEVDETGMGAMTSRTSSPLSPVDPNCWMSFGQPRAMCANSWPSRRGRYLRQISLGT
jgi:hypothetical protein